jgi:hypothetical protein
MRIKTYKTIILPVVLYGCGTVSNINRRLQTVAAREQGAKEIFTLKRDQIIGG